MRGHQEQNVIDLIKSVLNDSRRSCLYWFGCSEDDVVDVSELFDRAKANLSPSEFPDFTSDNAIIEHFEITSSEETRRKGSRQKRDDAIFKRTREQKIMEIEEAISQSTQKIGDVIVLTGKAPNQEHSHELLKKSFEKNCRQHLLSLAQYNKKLGRTSSDSTVFVVEYQDSALGMAEVYSGSSENRHMSFNEDTQTLTDISGRYDEELESLRHTDEKRFDYNMTPPIHLRSYRLCYDAELLLWIYENCKAVKFVVFVGSGCLGGGIEIIKTTEIPHMLKMIPVTVKTYPFQSTRTSFDVRFSL